MFCKQHIKNYSFPLLIRIVTDEPYSRASPGLLSLYPMVVPSDSSLLNTLIATGFNFNEVSILEDSEIGFPFMSGKYFIFVPLLTFTATLEFSYISNPYDGL